MKVGVSSCTRIPGHGIAIMQCFVFGLLAQEPLSHGMRPRRPSGKCSQEIFWWAVSQRWSPRESFRDFARCRRFDCDCCAGTLKRLHQPRSSLWLVLVRNLWTLRVGRALRSSSSDLQLLTVLAFV
eukprot:g27974.t2